MEIIDNIFEVLTSPKNLFDKINHQNYSSRLIYPLVVFLIVNIVLFTSKYDFAMNFGGYLPKLIFSCIGNVILWYIVCGFFEFIAKIGNKSGKLKQIMSCFAYSLFPLVLFAPIQILKPLGGFAYSLAVILEIIIYFWSVYLIAKAIEITYELTFSRAVMIIFLPVIASFISIFWIVEFITKMIFIFKA